MTRHGPARLTAVALLLLLYGGFLYYQFPATPAARAVSTRQHAVLNRIRAAREAAQSPPPLTPPPMARQTPAPTTALQGRKTMVFLVNFRDWKRCGETLKSMFENAVAPELLKVSVHDQIYEAEGEMQCVDAYCQLVGERKCRRAQIVSSKVDAKDAKGPTVARYMTEKALGDEDFCLGLDSHIVFVKGWDEKLVTHWESIENENAILTVYPKSTEFLTDHSKDNKMGLMCSARIESSDFDNMVQFIGVLWIDRTPQSKPRLHAQFAGGFNFGTCKSYKEVPNDPYTPILFYGEEYARAARLWTHGYDFYAPAIDIVFHWFETRSKIWERDWGERYHMLMKSRRRSRFMMGLPVSQDDFDHTDLDKYGLGKKRTFEQYVKFSGIDPMAKFNKTKYDQFDNCRELELVPYQK